MTCFYRPPIAPTSVPAAHARHSQRVEPLGNLRIAVCPQPSAHAGVGVRVVAVPDIQSVNNVLLRRTERGFHDCRQVPLRVRVCQQVLQGFFQFSCPLQVSFRSHPQSAPLPNNPSPDSEVVSADWCRQVYHSGEPVANMPRHGTPGVF